MLRYTQLLLHLAGLSSFIQLWENLCSSRCQKPDPFSLSLSIVNYDHLWSHIVMTVLASLLEEDLTLCLMFTPLLNFVISFPLKHITVCSHTMCIMYVVVIPCVLSLTSPVCNMETSWRKSQTLADCTTEALCSNKKCCIQALDT